MPESYRAYREEEWWNFVFILVYLVLSWWMWQVLSWHRALPTRLTVEDASLLGLSVFRMIRLLSYDRIFRYLRNYFFDKTISRALQAAEPMVEFTQARSGFRRSVAQLLACPWCTGVWIALPLVFLYYRYPFLKVGFILLSIAAVASLFQVIANAIGWTAEFRKKTTEALENES